MQQEGFVIGLDSLLKTFSGRENLNTKIKSHVDAKSTLQSDSTGCHVVLFFQIICGQNCTFVIEPNGTVTACGEGSYGRLGQGNSDDLHTLVVISALQGKCVL